MGPSVRHIYFLWVFCWAQWKPWLLMNRDPENSMATASLLCLVREEPFHLELQPRVCWSVGALQWKPFSWAVSLLSHIFHLKSNFYVLPGSKAKTLKAAFSPVFKSTEVGVPIRYKYLNLLEGRAPVWMHYKFRDYEFGVLERSLL